MRKFTSALAAAVLLTALAACETTGTGTAASRTGDVTATLSWRSTDNVTGTMTAQLSNGASYAGPYFEITHETRVQDMGPLWDGWVHPSRRFGYWGPYQGGPQGLHDWEHFVTHYSGRVVANLAAQDGSHMRCRFQLAHPQQGMGGGGQGVCELPDGRTIDALFAEQ